MQWWCSAQGIEWTWRWRAYPGVWLIVIGAFVMLRRLAPGPLSKQGMQAAIAACAVLWLALDWPVGPLGAGYLASAHAVQFLLIAFVAAPLMLLPVRDVVTAGRPRALAERYAWVSQPLLTAIVFNLVVVVTHVPAVVDAAMVTPLGDFALDMAWLLGAMLFWWPVIVPVPARPRFGTPMKILYLLFGTLFHSGVAIVMLMSDYPLYRVYEFAPRMSILSPIDDQQLAGGVMEIGGVALIIGYVSLLFFRMAAQTDSNTGKR
jgi:cytochrome c oxidase assembly factor CtaG